MEWEVIFIPMDKDLKKLINETLDQTFAEAPEKLIERGIREIQVDICPHCKHEIHEKHEYTEDGGITWRHSDCKGMISRPETPLEQINRGLRPYVEEAREQRHKARQALGIEAVEKGFPPLDVIPDDANDLPLSGDKKYCRDNQTQMAPFPVNTTGLGEVTSKKSEREERKPIAVMDYVKFMDGMVRVVNTSNIPVEVTITEITVASDGVNGKAAYIIRIDNPLPRK